MANSAFGNFAVQSTMNSPEGDAAPVPRADTLEFTKLFQRYEQFVLFDAEKSKFVNDLMTTIQRLELEKQQLAAGIQRDYAFVSNWATEKLQYTKRITVMQRALEENPFVMVLIDGDGMIFDDDLIRGGEAGGRRTACALHAAIQGYIDSELMDVPHNSRILCRIYANVRGLADVLVRSGAVSDIGIFEDFVRGFTRGKILFDFVDVGAGKDRADEKIIESLKMFSQDFHCRRILFGCSHDNGYARVLEECSDRVEVVSKVVLLEGVPFEKELQPLPYSTKKFPGLFRDTKIVLPGGTYMQHQPCRADQTIAPGTVFNMCAGLPSRFPAPIGVALPGFLESPIPHRAALAHGMTRTPSSSTVASDAAHNNVNHSVNKWAAIAAAPPPPAPATPEPPRYVPANRDETIHRNRTGQRVDPPCKDYDKAEVDRVKKLKLCNIYYLRQDCPFIHGDCTHTHSYKATKAEVATLRLVARMAPCVFGGGCADRKCIYGHRCPAPPHRNHAARKGGKTCIFGKDCKFTEELHDIDTNVFKTLVVK